MMKSEIYGEVLILIMTITNYHMKPNYFTFPGSFGCRLSEVLLSSWVEWDFDKKLWRVPADHSKKWQGNNQTDS